MLHYRLIPLCAPHQWRISFSFSQHEARIQTIKLANWVAGSYMIRDFSRHIIQIQAACNGEMVPLTQISKNEWHTPERAGEYVIHYTVYANDLSVRASLLDNERGFIDGACLFLYLPERCDEICHVQFEMLPNNWRIHTTLPEIDTNCFQAASYAELIDHPMELGANLETLTFSAHGITHRITLSGHYRDFDRERLRTDCQKICQTELDLFPAPAPFHDYLFLLHLGDNIYGGLEHRSSSALHADRNALPAQHMGVASPEYTQLLGLIAHEYFHAWNVKSIKPSGFLSYNLDKECYTEQLWAFEGITSFYDDLILARSRVITPEQYLDLLAQTITRVQRNIGRKWQTLAQSSFTAWHKYYKQDENAPNAITSYYQQGALTAFCLDQTIRARSHWSLDTVMQTLYRQWCDTGKGIDEQQWQQHAQRITGLNLQDFFQAALYQTDDLPLSGCLKRIGVQLTYLAAPCYETGKLVRDLPHFADVPDLGCRYQQQTDRAIITHVFNDGSTEHAGLKPQDSIIAIDGFACTDFAAQTATRVGETHRVDYFRHGVLQHTNLTIQAASPNTAYLQIIEYDLLENWLFGQNSLCNTVKSVKND